MPTSVSRARSTILLGVAVLALACLAQACALAISTVPMVMTAMEVEQTTITYEMPRSAEITWNVAVTLVEDPARKLTIVQKDPRLRSLYVKRDGEWLKVNIVAITKDSCQVIMTGNNGDFGQDTSQTLVTRAATDLADALGVSYTIIQGPTSLGS